MLECLQAAAVGKIPGQVLFADAEALASGNELPYAKIQKEASAMARPSSSPGPRMAGPLDHN